MLFSEKNNYKLIVSSPFFLGKTYKQGSYIPVIVDITANHQGYFIFKLCPNNDIFQDPGQNCFDQRPLWVGGGDSAFNQTRYPINDYETGLRMVYVRLPMDVICEQCILQWTYVAGKKEKKREFSSIVVFRTYSS